MDYILLGRRIRLRRREAGLTQEQLAEKAEISPSFLGHVERGSRKLSLETLLKLCRALNTTADALLGCFDGAPPPEWSEAHRAAVMRLLEEAHQLAKTMK